jgi:hypothetical protein
MVSLGLMSEKTRLIGEVVVVQISQCLGCSNSFWHAKTFEALI